MTDIIPRLRNVAGIFPQQLHRLLEEAAGEIERLRERDHLLTARFQNGFDSHRVLKWIDQPERKRSFFAFTAGEERQAAYLVEYAEHVLKAEIERLRAEVIQRQSINDAITKQLAGLSIMTPEAQDAAERLWEIVEFPEMMREIIDGEGIMMLSDVLDCIRAVLVELGAAPNKDREP